MRNSEKPTAAMRKLYNVLYQVEPVALSRKHLLLIGERRGVKPVAANHAINQLVKDGFVQNHGEVFATTGRTPPWLGRSGRAKNPVKRFVSGA